MNLHTLLGPNTPEWLLWTSVFVTFVLLIMVVAWAQVLERKYEGPYTLAAASSPQKWRWAVALAFWKTAPMPLLGLVEPIMSPYPGQWPAFPLFCGGLWIVVLPAVVIHERFGLEQSLKRYRSIDNEIRNGTINRLLLSPPMKLFSWLMSEEQKCFYREGYAEDDAGVKARDME
jgi:hypothetical protein